MNIQLLLICAVCLWVGVFIGYFVAALMFIAKRSDEANEGEDNGRH